MLSVTYVQNYLRETAYNATDNGQIYPCLHYAPSALSLNGDKHFPTIKRFLSLMSKGVDGRYEALLPTTYILRALEARSLLGGPYSKAACIFDFICLGLQMIYSCSKYCHENPTSQYKKSAKSQMCTYTGTFAGYNILFINSYFSFMLESSHFVYSADSLSKASYLRF